MVGFSLVCKWVFIKLLFSLSPALTGALLSLSRIATDQLSIWFRPKILAYIPMPFSIIQLINATILLFCHCLTCPMYAWEPSCFIIWDSLSLMEIASLIL